MNFGQKAAEAHYADGHRKGCSPACAVEIGFIEDALRKAAAWGIRRYAWWRDGEQYVGTTGTTLKQALEEVEADGGEGVPGVAGKRDG